MGVLSKAKDISLFEAPLLVNSLSTKEPRKSSKARFAKLCMHVIRECATTGNLAMLPVVAYLSLNSYNPSWTYSNAAIQKETGLDRKTVAKCLKRLEELGVLKPVAWKDYRPSAPRNVKSYILIYARFLELFETIPTESVAVSMGNNSPLCENALSVSMGNGSLSMGNESLSMGNNSTLYGDSLPTNRIEIENERRKDVIDADNVLNSPSLDDEDKGDYDLAYYEAMSPNEDLGDYRLGFTGVFGSISSA